MITLLPEPTQPQPGESVVKEMQDRSREALECHKNAAIKTFHLLWDDEPSRADKLAVMGTNAVLAFEQHARTIQYLLASGVEIDPEDYTPPVAYTAHDDGTITLA